MKNKCVFCHGKGVAKYFDFQKLELLQNSTYDLSDLIDKYGEFSECPEGCYTKTFLA